MAEQQRINGSMQAEMEAAEEELARLDELLQMADQHVMVDPALEERLKAVRQAAVHAAAAPAPFAAPAPDVFSAGQNNWPRNPRGSRRSWSSSPRCRC